MTRQDIVAHLREHEADLRAVGVDTLSIFGSSARLPENPSADIDVLVRFQSGRRLHGLDYFGQVDSLRSQIETILGRPVDLVAEPLRKPSLRDEIERDRFVAF